MTHGTILCNVHPKKEELNQTRLTMGSDKINILMICGIPMTSLLTVKLLLNSIVSTPGAKFLGMDLQNFYLTTPVERP